MKSKREAILIAGVILAALIFVFDRYAPEIKKNQIEAEHKVEAARDFVKQQEAALKAKALKPHEQIMLNVLLQDLPSNPFARHWIAMIADQKRINSLSTIEPVLSYNGYIRAGDRFIALINDADYEEGNKIEHVPLYVRNISPDRIDVENPNTVSESRLSIKILPLKVEDEEL